VTLTYSAVYMASGSITNVAYLPYIVIFNYVFNLFQDLWTTLYKNVLGTVSDLQAQLQFKFVSENNMKCELPKRNGNS
jgi:hypothetical protein